MSDYKPIVDYLLTREALNHFENTWVRHSWDDISPLGHVRPFDDELVAVSVKLPEGMAQLMDSMTNRAGPRTAPTTSGGPSPRRSIWTNRRMPN